MVLFMTLTNQRLIPTLDQIENTYDALTISKKKSKKYVTQIRHRLYSVDEQMIAHT
jgi:hypothetical protein